MAHAFKAVSQTRTEVVLGGEVAVPRRGGAAMGKPLWVSAIGAMANGARTHGRRYKRVVLLIKVNVNYVCLFLRFMWSAWNTLLASGTLQLIVRPLVAFLVIPMGSVA